MKAERTEEQTKEDVAERIGQLAESYTPEWKFDPASPDVGTALALLFAEMFEGTLRRYRKIPGKLHRSFFELLGETLLPSAPAEGYVTFGLSTREFGGVTLEKGTVVMAQDSRGGSGEVAYETTDTLYVTPAQISQIIYTDGQQDYIGKKDPGKPFAPFLAEEKNLQEHVLYLCQDEMLDVAGNAQIGLKLLGAGAKEDGGFQAEEAFVISYGTEEGFVPFAHKRMENGWLLLERQEGQPVPAERTLFERKGYWLSCRYEGAWKREPFAVQDIRLAARRTGIAPDLIQTALGEQKDAPFFPFGECPTVFGECYFASGEALGKAGAKVRLTFTLDYERIPFDNSVKTEPRWKILMKRSDFVPDPEYDITIEQVVWEYYNGNGFSRLPVSDAYEGIFNGSGGAGKQIELEFLCPSDAALLEWECAPTRYIRVRVLRMNNLFQWKGAYITPVLRDVRFHYAYLGAGRHPKFAAAVNQMEQKVFPVGALGRGPVFWEIFRGLREQTPWLYIGFDLPLHGGPVKLFAKVEKTVQNICPQLVFEYYGRKGFVPLLPSDETKGFTRSGCLTLPGQEDFTACTVCGERACFIRITAEGDACGRPGLQPRIEGMFLNTTGIRATEQRPPEYFHVEAGEKHKVCALSRGNVCELTVWVNELSNLTAAQRERMRAEGRLREVQDEKGQLTGLWVRWEEVSDFRRSGEDDRHYLLDANEGVVTFSDGKKGAIPASGENETVCICYRCGGGECGNQPPAAIWRMGKAAGFVNSVTNPLPILGGYEQETVFSAIRRGEAAFRHTGRAVTAADYEALALEASRFVEKVACYPGYNGSGTYEPGCITLVVLQKGFADGGLYFEKIREEIRSYLSSRMDGNLEALGRLYVTEPRFFLLNCHVKVTAADTAHTFEVRKCVEERLCAFIHPVTGNYHKRGWEIGTIPNETQLMNALKSVPGVRFVEELWMTAVPRDGVGAAQTDMRFAVAISGKHTIVVE